jgi:Cu(I)/Ag(I) efflux system membrane fusion protein
VLSPAAAQRARIETAPVVRRFLSMPTRMVGKVAFDETRVRTIAARVAGRLDRLFVDYTGVQVQ